VPRARRGILPRMPRAKKTKTPSFAVARTTLDNGLRVVVAPDRSSPAVMVAAYYDVGFRSEPEGRTGFAHLFEHLMFEGSINLEKGMHDRLVNGNGGMLNGSTRNDFTNYFEIMPSNALELALYLEADRMRGLRLTDRNLRNQTDVVKEEVKVNVINQPYGGFPWLWLPMTLFDTFPNAHNAYGDFDDLEAATLDDASAFFDRYYAPGNAVLSITGDADPEETFTLVERHFGDIPAREVPATVEADEAVPTEERRGSREDPRAPQPALALAYRTPDPLSGFAEYLAMTMCSSILADGEASRLHQRLLKTDRTASHLSADVGLVAGTFEVRGPSMFHIAVWHPADSQADGILKAIDEEIDRVADGIEGEELDRFRNAWLADYLGSVDSLMARGMLVSALEQQRGRAELLNEIPAAIAEVTADQVSAVARTWLRPHKRAVLELRAGGAR
jgi:zinc protease